MNIEIISNSLQLTIYGFGSIAPDANYAAAAFKLSGKMWEVVKANNIKNKGKNIWVYESGHKVFAGVEIEHDLTSKMYGLEEKNITLSKYAYYKHVGPYKLIRQAGQAMTGELARQGFETTLPYIEIYGHWTPDESKLEAELLMCLK